MAYDKTGMGPETGISGPSIGPMTLPGGPGGVAQPRQQGDPVAQQPKQQTQGQWKGNFHADDVINQYFTGLSDQQRAYIRNQLANSGLSEHSQPQDFVKGLQSLAQGIPGLQAKSAANSLFGDGQNNAQGWDPLAQQMFFFKTIAPYLDQIHSQTQNMVNPMYADAAAALKNVPNHGGLEAMMKALQGSEENLQGSLAASTAIAPSLDALMQNVSQARQTAQKDFYEQERAAVYGNAGGSGGLGSLQALLGGQTST